MKSVGKRLILRLTCSFSRLVGIPYRAAKSESRITFSLHMNRILFPTWSTTTSDESFFDMIPSYSVFLSVYPCLRWFSSRSSRPSWWSLKNVHKAIMSSLYRIWRWEIYCGDYVFSLRIRMSSSCLRYKLRHPTYHSSIIHPLWPRCPRWLLICL